MKNSSKEFFNSEDFKWEQVQRAEIRVRPDKGRSTTVIKLLMSSDSSILNQ